ncbi:signal transduction histidine kinase [Pelomonas saccharophila]|uniref:Signal transduction histidine kinase n=1 Tax=Roseateles saccharophilus TaxID=304 RepID=A0ABU1YM92_ROSSA|nr:histidine kinase [Roseateles saccharophilus]MDR7269111.1 signal transduction histidine kinase [Roseateles saccharophilus]
MPPAPPADRVAPLHWRALLAAAALSAALATALLLPGALRCALWREHDCRASIGLKGGIGLALLLWGLWLAAALTQPLLPRAGVARRWGLAVQIGGLTLLFATLNGVLHTVGVPDGRLNAYTLQMLLTFAACVCLGLEYRQRGSLGQADAERLQRNEQTLARQLDEARAALLQAQVEPHFLFNTLAHLRRLARTDAQAAHAMLADLRRYLAAALPELRQAETPLARELELVVAFLALHQRRIGPERLALRYEIAPGLEDVIVPSTCLLTLAENAIKHGISPQVEGGEICVRAGPDPEAPGLLRLEVADTGAGMGSSSGSGTGLATLRARLAAAHGAEAKLSLHLNQPRGLIARVQLPWPGR